MLLLLLLRCNETSASLYFIDHHHHRFQTQGLLQQGASFLLLAGTCWPGMLQKGRVGMLFERAC